MTKNQDSTGDNGRVTVVVPVYGDWTSLRNCVASLIEHADTTRYDVLLVNDVGPDADEIEAGLLAMIFGQPTFRYARNPHNLGFVGTCNRAVEELDTSDNDVILLNSDTVVTAGALDELCAVLALDDHYGVVCPRSNDATIATMPFLRRESSAPRSPERARTVFEALSPRLPRYYIAPVSVGFCILIRRDLIEEHGLFDPVFGAGYSEENDLCLRLNAIGISSLISNHAFVYHVGSSSFGSEQRLALDERNSRVVRERYPHYPASVVSFVHHDFHPVDRFADLLVEAPSIQAQSLLILIGDDDGTSVWDECIVPRLEKVLGAAPPQVSITVACRSTMISEPAIASPRVTYVDPAELNSLFDLGLAISPVTSTEHLALLNRYCLRWLLVGPRADQLGSWAARASQPEITVIARLAVQYADRVVWQSKAERQAAMNILNMPGSAANATIGDIDSGPYWENALATLLSEPADANGLESRDSAIRPIAIAAEAASLNGANLEMRRMRESRSYRLASRLASLAQAPRRLLLRR